MNYIVTCQEQIIALSFRSGNLQAFKHFVEVLTRLISVHGLASMSLLYQASRNLSLREFERAMAAFGWTPLVDRGLERPIPPFYLPSLSACDILEISNPAWVNEVKYSPSPLHSKSGYHYSQQRGNQICP
jgi:hypothetical protein